VQSFSNKIKRYSRQTLIDWIGLSGQRRLEEKRVLIIGCGALGSTVANNLVRAGVGHIKIVDRDYLELENLQRQMLFDEEDVKLLKPKAIAAREKLQKINSQVCVQAEICDVNRRNIEELLDGIELTIDGTDNLETRFLINDACFKHKIPWIYGACVASYGMTMSFFPKGGPCFRCIISSLPPPGTLPTCDTVGILNAVPQIVGAIQTNEAIKILLEAENICKDLIYFDLSTNEFVKTKIERRKDCPLCEGGVFEYLEGKFLSSAVALCGRNAVQISPERELAVPIEKMAEKLRKIGEVSYAGYLLKFKKEEYELVIFPDGRVMVKGTEDISLAKSLYAKYVGH